LLASESSVYFRAPSLRTRIPEGLEFSCPQPVPEHPARWVRFLLPGSFACLSINYQSRPWV